MFGINGRRVDDTDLLRYISWNVKRTRQEAQGALAGHLVRLRHLAFDFGRSQACRIHASAPRPCPGIIAFTHSRAHSTGPTSTSARRRLPMASLPQSFGWRCAP